MINPPLNIEIIKHLHKDYLAFEIAEMYGVPVSTIWLLLLNGNKL